MDKSYFLSLSYKNKTNKKIKQQQQIKTLVIKTSIKLLQKCEGLNAGLGIM